MSNTFYITTTLPYVNAKPHIGFALELVQADVIARYQRICGKNVIFNTGTDEHGLKIYQKAVEAGLTPQAYCDSFAAIFQKLKHAYNLSYTHFTRTTDPSHKQAAQAFWIKCRDAGFIDKKMYDIQYCVGCELEKTDSELVDGRCPLHPNVAVETIKEENYFFKFSAFQQSLLALYADNRSFVVPEFRLREIENFITEDAVDFSISRLASKMPWGIPVPGDEAHVMYVWFDALINYISVLGWPDDLDTFQDAWPGVQIAGKDNLRQQSAMWQAMLASVGLPHSSQIIIHGFITSNGQKMSKSLGNVVDPFDQVEKFGTDAVRYYLIAEIPTFDDGDYSETRFVELYNADLANGIGNHTSRILKLAEGMKYVPTAADATLYEAVDKHMRAYESGSAIMALRTQLSQYSKALDADHPWTIKETHLKQEILITHLRNLYQFAYNLQIFLPDTANQILDALSAPSITAPKPLFARI